jgi:type IV pilus assembly protein PilB
MCAPSPQADFYCEMASKTKVEPSAAQRKFKRRELRVTVALRIANGTVVTGTSSDLSLGGLRMLAADTLAVKDKCTARISSGARPVVNVDVEIVWKQPAEAGNAKYGLRFAPLTEPQRYSLLEYIYGTAVSNVLPESNGSSTDSRADARERPADSQAGNGSNGASGVYGYYVRLLRRIEQVHHLNPSDTDQVLASRLLDGKTLREALVLAKVVDDNSFETFMSAVYGVEYADLKRNRPDPGVADAIPANLAIAQNVVPVERVDGRLVIAMADPLDLPLLDIVKMRNHDQVEVRFAPIEDVQNALHDVYQELRLRLSDSPLDMFPAEYQDSEVEDLEMLRKMSDATPVVSLVDSMLRLAVEDEASDIHFEPWPDKALVRFRLDGVLHAVRSLPRQIYPAVISRIKIMARMDITVRHLPQDGRASMRYAKKDFDLRISSVPTHHGEKIVIRLLEKNPTFKTLSAVGLNDANYKLMAPLIQRPHGMILCTGPTGSGKSTTLFAILQEINDGTTNITTIEDPIEYSVNGVNQIEVNAKRGLTFGSVLRALLRQDPDVIYVGEIRDRETAELAVRAALTGHLLLSTLHTNTAVQAIARLMDIGVDPALIGASIIAVVGQRLLRKICDKCKEPYELKPEELPILAEMIPVNTPRSLFYGKGCPACHETGYRGRMPVHEVVVIDEGLRRLIAVGANSGQLLDHVTKSSTFADLRADAVQRMVDGKTTFQEVLRMTV